jgi:DNA-binding SARP family transcriptional activator
MVRLALRFFGTPRLSLDRAPVKLDRRKAEALLAFLAVEPGEHRRSELALLFWPEQSTSGAKAALRRALCSLTGALGKEWLDIDRSTVSLRQHRRLWCDVSVFREKLSQWGRHPHGTRRVCDGCAEAVTEAVMLQEGDFLSGLTLRDSSAFDEWQHTQAEKLRSSLVDALHALTLFHKESGRGDEALRFARRAVRLEPLDERSHESLMKLFIAGGRRGAAVRLYESFAERLERELGIAPPKSIVELCRHAQTGGSVGAPGGLSIEEQRAFTRLTIFQGVFDSEVASHVADVRLGTLESLGRKGLVEEAGRERLRLAAGTRERFAKGQELSAALQASHGRYYLELLRSEGLEEPLDLGTVAAAWNWACRRNAHDLLEGALDPLHSFVDRKGFYRDGIALFGQALEAVDEGPLLVGLLARQAVLYACTGQLEKARALLESALRLAKEARLPLEIAFCKNRMGHVLFALGSDTRARRCLRESVRDYGELGNASGLCWSLNVLGHLSIGTSQARSMLSESLARGRRAKDRQRVASTLNSLGKDALVRGDLSRARRSLEEALELRRARDHRIGIADSLNNLGGTFLAMRDQASARQCFEEALDLARAIEVRPLVVEVLNGMAGLHQAAGEFHRAAEITSSALYLPGGWRDAKERASARLVELSGALSSRAMETAVAKGRRFDVVDRTGGLRAE